MQEYEPISTENISRYSIGERKSIVDVSKCVNDFGNVGVLPFVASLPDILAAKDLKQLIEAIADARLRGCPVVLGMGGHPIKVGLSPLIVDLMQNGVITAIATNGSAIVHDFELAYIGHTSEDVASELTDGSFGMARETGIMINQAINQGATDGIGLGMAMGKLMADGKKFPHSNLSIFAQAYRLAIPATVHVAIGTDIIHMHPEADGESIGKTSLLDFKIFTSVVSHLEGGVFINLGSAVIIPEVFLKALTLARNLGHKVDNIVTVTMDFNKHYRPMENVVRRPTSSGGKGYYLIGHHEIMFPLLAIAVKEKLKISNPMP